MAYSTSCGRHLKSAAKCTRISGFAEMQPVTFLAYMKMWPNWKLKHGWEKVWHNRKMYMCVFAIFLSIIIQIQFKSAEKAFPGQPSRTSEHAVWKLLSSSKDTDEQCCLLWVCSEQFLLLWLTQYIHHVQHQHYLQHWICLVKDKQIKRNGRQRMNSHTCPSSQDPEWPYYIWIFAIFCASFPAICWHIDSFKLKIELGQRIDSSEYNKRSSCHKSQFDLIQSNLLLKVLGILYTASKKKIQKDIGPACYDKNQLWYFMTQLCSHVAGKQVMTYLISFSHENNFFKP